MKIKLIFSILVTLALHSCKNDSESKDIYFGGLIVNPTSKFVVLLKKDVVVDTFYLDSENKFGGKLINAEKGLYVFKHPPENQITYLEPGDSTLVFLNTLEFDESLTFSGNGAEKSNFLNTMYLLNQENNDLILKNYQLSPANFVAKTDSIREARINNLERTHNRKNFSDEFYKLALSTINYEYYDLRERYAYLLRKYSRETINQLPEDFHAYRKDISFNDEELEDYYVYLNLIDDYLRTRSLEYCAENNIKEAGCYELSDYKNIRRRIILVDSLIENERIKNIFVDRLAAQGIIFSKSREEIIAVLDLLKEIDYSGKRNEDFRQMGGIQNALLPGNNVGEMKLLTTNLDTIQLKDISNNPKITYHWSLNAQRHHKWQHKLINELRVKYPEIEFIGINIDRDQVSAWKNSVQNQSYNAEFEYKLPLMRVNEVLLKNYLNKLIFVDGKGKIVRGDVQINSLDHETSILEFLSQN
ncbi:hypothetical protein FK178_07390 [Antarcticibacterium arcticum]|uniref:Thioredoxin domain-containing protein n=1 Tax=Antarcticibacterium arcticum TaxID=2585771 RepID=A0A5B8YHY6_9FLAO|nr:hypothetical protein [Antarcticibacterium arcticum]QED37560.1 hypothetical protein FK178_07390 [Antarcticibacterium arcticum]